MADLRRLGVRALRAVIIALGVAPFVVGLLDESPEVDWLTRPLDAWFAFQCERDPARMLAAGAVCARCLGIYAGMALGALGFLLRLRSKRLELGLGVAVVLMLADVASERLGWRVAWAPLRIGTGLALGFSATVVLMNAIETPASSLR